MCVDVCTGLQRQKVKFILCVGHCAGEMSIRPQHSQKIFESQRPGENALAVMKPRMLYGSQCLNWSFQIDSWMRVYTRFKVYLAL